MRKKLEYAPGGVIEKVNRRQQKHEIIPSMQRIKRFLFNMYCSSRCEFLGFLFFNCLSVSRLRSTLIYLPFLGS